MTPQEKYDQERVRRIKISLAETMIDMFNRGQLRSEDVERQIENAKKEIETITGKLEDYRWISHPGAVINT